MINRRRSGDSLYPLLSVSVFGCHGNEPICHLGILHEVPFSRMVDLACPHAMDRYWLDRLSGALGYSTSQVC